MNDKTQITVSCNTSVLRDYYSTTGSPIITVNEDYSIRVTNKTGLKVLNCLSLEELSDLYYKIGSLLEFKKRNPGTKQYREEQ